MVSPGIDRTRTLRGAVCGAVAAAVWALQQPLDKLVFGSRFDDVELLGKAVTRGEGWYADRLRHASGTARCSAPCTRTSRLCCRSRRRCAGRTAALVEHTAAWPLGAVSDRVHPARDELPTLSGNRRAFAQELWRHLLFGVVLGELERRLNAEPEPVPPPAPADYSSNGHGHSSTPWTSPRTALPSTERATHGPASSTPCIVD